MQPIYAREKTPQNIERKIILDMAYLVTHKKIRMLKRYWEEGLYIPYKPKGKDSIEHFNLTKNVIKKEDDNFFYFDFPFKPNQIEFTS